MDTMKTTKVKFTKEMIESIKDKLPRLSFLLLFLRQCYGGCGDRTHLLPCSITTSSTRFLNLSDRPVELQIRVGSILKRVHTLKPGRSKNLRHSNLHRAYVPDQEGRRWLYYDDTCLPYVWVHETGTDLSKMVKQQSSGDPTSRDSREPLHLTESDLYGKISNLSLLHLLLMSRPDHSNYEEYESDSHTQSPHVASGTNLSPSRKLASPSGS